MNYKLITVLAMGAMVLGAAPSFADNDYYVELGRDASSDDATQQWNELVKKHKTMLGKLHFFPKSVIEDGNTVNTRIQAGPITSKEKAQKICTKLFKDDVPCFVIEGVGSAPPTSMMNLSQQSVKAVRFPWLTGSDVAPPAPIQELPVAVNDDVESQPSPKNRQADVRVAEAIRVPLTQSEDQQKNAQVVVKALPEIKSPFAPSADGAKYSDESSDSGAGWLAVEAFANKDMAASFWRDVRASAPKEAKKLRVRILQPLAKSDQPQISLNVGPFASSSAAYTFCRESVQASARGLTCHFDSKEPEADANDAKASGGKRVTRQKKAEEAVKAAPAAAVGKYWIQVATAPSQPEAMQLWDDFKDKNEDLIKGMRNRISPSSKDKDTYVVRVGPIEDNDEAVNSCAQMQARGIDCRVIQYAPAAGKR